MKTEFFSFSELRVSRGDIEEVMGFEPDESPAPFPEIIDSGLLVAPQLCRITGGYQIVEELKVDPGAETMTLNEQVFNPGKIVVTQLQKAGKAALFICTAGAEITEAARQKSAEGDEMMAFVLDTIGSVTVDKAADYLLEKVLAEVSLSGFGITDSFSPGYCNWNVAEQQKLFQLLPPGACNITLSPTSLMHPVKSVSGVVGIGTGCERTGYQCHWCPDKDCIYGKIRRRKKNKKNL